MSESFVIIEPEWNNSGFEIQHQGGRPVITFDLIRDPDGRKLPIPLRRIPPGRMPPEFDAFRRQNGVYIIVEADSHVPVYVGESHTDRLIHTATRHIQSWDLGPTWDRDDVLFGFILCSDPASAYNLQNLVIAELILNGVELANNTQDRPEEFDSHEPDDPPF